MAAGFLKIFLPLLGSRFKRGAVEVDFLPKNSKIRSFNARVAESAVKPGSRKDTGERIEKGNAAVAELADAIDSKSIVR